MITNGVRQLPVTVAAIVPDCGAVSGRSLLIIVASATKWVSKSDAG
jgi:hypothetical protein